MKILNWTEPNLTEEKVACLGFFDGIHPGHLKLLEQVGAIKAVTNNKSLFFTLSKRVTDFFNNNQTAIISNKAKEEIIAQLGFDYYLSVLVSEEFLALSWFDFLTILKERFNVTKVVVGSDFCFGKDRLGNVDKLISFFGKDNVTIVSRDFNYSSSTIRKLLEEHQIIAANKMLFQKYQIIGIVEKGEQQGRLINFPTANLYLKNKLLIPYGVYVSTVIYQKQQYQGMTCYWNKNGQERVETYLLNFDGDLYGRELTIIFEDYLRDNISVNSLADLKITLEKDLKNTIDFFHNKA
ncbi:bifunctional riboflavin kinase/FMN adenylyltransferase [Spiroplasma syrphidicola EA-1]|uniref:Riboflavin biosynthesis protein n=1 Tax=Spiroplasma syrphidicola EA-1 TaxID=1276229 RepID=R4ULW4_9MOLU|nr:riboflavin kinase [Spiroplasma syrphidicola]AGM26206.1 bifunctional riboflavin kinase/FMN adenylyltransferase [Spiroplasma syrphidicola EA-1]